MKPTSAAQKAAQRSSAQDAGQAASAGPRGMSIAPPAYGVESVDRAMGQNKPEAPVQRKARPAMRGGDALSGHTPNQTGLPDSLKSGVESLSGFSLDDVRVYYNSPKPMNLNALAYTQGTDIHVAPGQERHLPHEAWHVVQQKQGRVQATMQMKNAQINDDAGLEQEATQMGARASSVGRMAPFRTQQDVIQNKTATSQVVQRITEYGPGATYVPMDYWGYNTLTNEGDSIATDSMSTCVSIAIYNDQYQALIAHFGRSETMDDPQRDVEQGAAEILNAIDGEFGGTWQGYIFTGRDLHPVSEQRIQTLKKILGKSVNLKRERQHMGIRLKREGEFIVPVWLMVTGVSKTESKRRNSIERMDSMASQASTRQIVRTDTSTSARYSQ